MPQNKPTTSATSLFLLADRKRFIDALNKDISSSMHGSETNFYALRQAIRMIEELTPNSKLSLEQLIRGALNYALHCEHNKYGVVNGARVGKDEAKRFHDTSQLWFNNTKDLVAKINGMNNAQEKEKEKVESQLIEKIIKAASKSPLFIAPGCAFNTLAVYFEYVTELNPDFPVPELPPHPKDRVHPLLNKNTQFKLIIVEQQATVSQLDPLAALKKQVSTATKHYVDYNESVWYSLFHRHGATGRARAQQFDELFQKIGDLEEAQKVLINYLTNDTNGNTHPHSYRTMLATKILGKDKNSYQAVSENYPNEIKQLSSQLDALLKNSNSSSADSPRTPRHCGL